MDEVETVEEEAAKPASPWYESNLLWVPIGFVVSILLALIVALKHEFRWLLWAAWFFSFPTIWFLAKRTREVWIVLALGVVLSGVACLGLNYWLKPSPMPTAPIPGVAISKPGQTTPLSQPKPEQPTTVPVVQPPSNSSPVKRKHTSAQVAPNPAAPTAPVQLQSPVTVNSAPNGFAVSGGTLDHPTVNNFAPPSRHLTGEQSGALSDKSIHDVCYLSIDPHNLHEQEITIRWEPTVEAANFAKDFVSALGPSVGLRSPYELDGKARTGLFLETNDWEHPDECAARLRDTFNLANISYQFAIIPRRGIQQQMPIYRGNKLIPQPPPLPPPDDIVIVVGTNE